MFFFPVTSIFFKTYLSCKVSPQEHPNVRSFLINAKTTFSFLPIFDEKKLKTLKGKQHNYQDIFFLKISRFTALDQSEADAILRTSGGDVTYSENQNPKIIRFSI